MRINNTTELQPKDTRKKVIYLEAALWPSVSVTVPWLIILNGRCSIAMFTTMRAALESTRINIFGVCVSESVQDRENEIHVKDGGDGLLSPFRSVCWSIWTCIFHSNTSFRQLEQEVCVCVGGGAVMSWQKGRWAVEPFVQKTIIWTSVLPLCCGEGERVSESTGVEERKECNSG